MRLAVRIGLSVLMTPMLAALFVLPGAAEEVPISLGVHLGYRDVVRPGQWMPVTVDATNKGPDFAGTLEVGTQDAIAFGKGAVQPWSPSRSEVVSQVAVALPAGATKHFRTYLLTDNPGASVAVRLLRDGRTVASQSVRASNSTSLLVGVLSDEPNTFDDFGAVRLTSNTPTMQVVHLQREDLADSGILLRAFDVLAIDDFATDSLTSAQRNALGDYVANGGNLLVGTGISWRKTLAGIPQELLPVRLDGTATLARTAALPGIVHLEIATGGPPSGDVWLSEGSRPLLVETTVGKGLVTLATFDWAQEPIATWSGARPLLRQVAIRSLLRGPEGIQSGFGVGGMGMGTVLLGGPASGGYGSSSVIQRGSLLLSVLGDIPSLDLPPLRVSGLLVLLYIVIIGPLNFLVLRRIGRLELAWVTVPAIAIVFAAGAYGVGLSTKGRAVQSNQVSILHLLPGWKSAYRETYTGIFTPTRGDFAVRLTERALIAPIVTYGPSGATTGNLRIHTDQGSVELLGVTAYTLRAFATESMVAFTGLTANLRLAEGKLTGRVENHSSIRFNEILVLAGDSFQTLGELAPGGSAQVSLEPSSSSSITGGVPLPGRIYPGGFKGGSASAAQHDASQRQQILQMLLGANVGQATRPTLIAWTGEPLEAITVNGHSPRAHAQNAIVMPLSIDQFVSGALPAGLIAARLVDSTGEVTLTNVGILVRDGSATFEFKIPALGGRLAQPGVRDSNPYAQKFTGRLPSGSSSATFQSEVWDWSRSTWGSISLKANDTTAIPETAIDPSTGAVRLRVRSGSSAMVQIGNLSLTGTLQ